MRLAGAFIDASVFIAIVDANVRSHNASVTTNKVLNTKD
jgi:predicted nucleic acid-binding protein